jgi:uncharacterized protein (DUF58 family)
MALLDRTAQRLLDRLRLAVRPGATARDQGGHRSPSLAQGLEVADHRPYVPGDDVRRIDWKAFVRHRQLVVRTFQEERDARVLVLLDASDSMLRGEPPKIDAGKRLALAFAYAAASGFDRVRVVPFASDADMSIAQVRSRVDVPALDRAIEGYPSRGLTRFPDAVREVARRLPGKGMAVVVSDLMATQGWDEGLRLLGGLGHDVVVVRVACREDDHPDLGGGEVELEDAETGETLSLRPTRALVEAYQQVLRDHLASVRSAVVRAGGRAVEVDAAWGTEALLRAALVRGAGVRSELRR